MDMSTHINHQVLRALTGTSQKRSGLKKGQMSQWCSSAAVGRLQKGLNAVAQERTGCALADGGATWMWDPCRGTNNFLKSMLCSGKETAPFTAEDPAEVCFTCDGVRGYGQGEGMVMAGFKMVDRRLPSQQATGNSNSQSKWECAPCLLSFGSEKEVNDKCKEFLTELKTIADNGHLNDDEGTPCHLKVMLVGDMKWKQTITGRGHASGAGQFCGECSCSAYGKTTGEPGGCLECKRAGTVYDENGTQICHHHSLNTVRCRKMRRARMEELREKLGDGVPLNIRPAYRNVEELRHECALRGMIGTKKNITGLDTAAIQKVGHAFVYVDARACTAVVCVCAYTFYQVHL